MLASRMLASLTGGDHVDAGQLPQPVPGLHTADPQRVSPQEVGIPL
jgi:hypothetical protein